MHSSLLLLVAEGGGFNPLDPSGAGIALWTWIIFLVALIPIWKVVMGPVTKALIARDAKAADAIVAAEKASRDAQAARDAVESKVAEAQKQAHALVEQARLRGEAVEKQVADQGRQQADALLARARTEIQAEQDKAIATIRKQVVDVSLAAASQVLKRKVDGADDKRLVEELVSTAREVRT